jgi:hypothetical protein
MSKANREKRRELEAQAAMATDLNILKSRPYLIQDVTLDAVDMMTPMGKVPGVRLTFIMQSGHVHEPILMDPMIALHIIAGITTGLTNPQALAQQGRPAPEPPGPSSDTPTDEAGPGPENVTPSGLIIPT